MFPLLGAVLGGIGGAQKRQGDLARQRQTGQAAADAQAVSWAKRGQQFIPEVEYAKGSMLGNVLGGAIGGGLQGSNIAGAMGAPAAAASGGGFDWLKNIGGSFGKSNPYSAATTGGFLGSDAVGDYLYDENKAKGYIGGRGPF